MRNRFVFLSAILYILVTMFFYAAPSFAEEDVRELKAQIEALQKRVEELEGAQEKQADDASWGFFNGRGSRSWDPFSEMERMQEEKDRMFQNSFSRRGLGGAGVFSNNMTVDAEMDIKETKNGYEIIFDMSGFDKEKFDIQINEHSITVKGEHNSEQKEESQNQYLQSKSFGSFMKTIPLPVDADTAKVKTEKKGDKLVITLPKKES